uniref:SAM domain-containing protein n=1 Tax=Kalanchoe fedtschenkoi TaxID=63787 RepID=A0A7N0SVN0_KALFE
MAESGPPETAPVAGESLQAPELPNTAPAQPPPTDSLGKRQRRPSVRLGEIGDQPAVLAYEANARRSKPWRLPKDSNKSFKTRPLTNLVHNGDCHETLDAEERNFPGEGHSEFGSRKLSSKKGTVRRARTNWSSKIEYAGEGDEKFGSRDDNNDAFEADASDSPLKDPSPVHSIDNETLNFWNRRPVRARVSDNDAIELENMPESDSRDRKCDSSADGVRDWLIGLGLGRYASVFEIHEVDDEVLPLLTLEDLKDMGINAVGSRRKMYTAIQKLRKGFS